ncbi:proteasome component [Streptomyces venezuelae]|nr:proteasome component [Streptomyces venezuelae]CUM36842.1 Pup ligase PafA' paralog, possible component of postulated heterodimer PafA-PafA' [Streptomyces venezuelae]
MILTNGARLYVDHAHPEYSSPEVTNPLDAVLWDKAGERIMAEDADQPPAACPNRGRFRWSTAARGVYHHQTKNLLVSYSPKKLGFFQRHKRGA